MEINDYSLRLTGLAAIPETLEVGDDITCGLNLSVYSAETKNNEDGTVSVVFKAKPTGEIAITKKWGKTPIKARVKNSPQARLRFALLDYHRTNGVTEDWETWYEKWVNKEIAKLGE